MENLEKRIEELSSEVVQLKEQIAKMAETLQSLERRNSEELSAKKQRNGPAFTLALSPPALQNRYHTGPLPYGLPPRSSHPIVAQPNPAQTLEIPVNTVATPQPIATVIPSATILQPHQPPLQPPINPYPGIAATIQTPHQLYYPQPSNTFNPPQSNQPQNSGQNTNQNTRQNQRKPNTQNRKTPRFDPIHMTYTELLPHLIQNSLVVPVPLKPVEPPYPRGYDQNAKCGYHTGAVGHSTENCRALKCKVQQLINAKWLNFKKNEPNVGTNPLPSHGGPSVSAVNNDERFESREAMAVIEEKTRRKKVKWS